MSADLINIQVIKQLQALKKNSGTDLLGKLLSIFENDFPKQISEMETALKAKDFETVARLAHKMRSSAGNVGANYISTIAGEIEEQIVDQEVQDEKFVKSGIENMKLKFKESVDAIRAA